MWLLPLILSSLTLAVTSGDFIKTCDEQQHTSVSVTPTGSVSLCVKTDYKPHVFVKAGIHWFRKGEEGNGFKIDWKKDDDSNFNITIVALNLTAGRTHDLKFYPFDGTRDRKNLTVTVHVVRATPQEPAETIPRTSAPPKSRVNQANSPKEQKEDSEDREKGGARQQGEDDGDHNETHESGCPDGSIVLGEFCAVFHKKRSSMADAHRQCQSKRMSLSADGLSSSDFDMLKKSVQVKAVWTGRRKWSKCETHKLNNATTSKYKSCGRNRAFFCFSSRKGKPKLCSWKKEEKEPKTVFFDPSSSDYIRFQLCVVAFPDLIKTIKLNEKQVIAKLSYNEHRVTIQPDPRGLHQHMVEIELRDKSYRAEMSVEVEVISSEYNRATFPVELRPVGCPKSLSAIGSSFNYVTLSWKPVPEFDMNQSYYVFYSKLSEGTWHRSHVRESKPMGGLVSWNVTGLIQDSRYLFKVVALSNGSRVDDVIKNYCSKEVSEATGFPLTTTALNITTPPTTTATTTSTTLRSTRRYFRSTTTSKHTETESTVTSARCFPPSTVRGQCPLGWLTTRDNSCVAFLMTPSFLEGYKDCSKKGGKLFSIGEKERPCVADFLNNTRYVWYGVDQSWCKLQDLSSGRWDWKTCQTQHHYPCEVSIPLPQTETVTFERIDRGNNSPVDICSDSPLQILLQCSTTFNPKPKFTILVNNQVYARSRPEHVIGSGNNTYVYSYDFVPEAGGSYNITCVAQGDNTAPVESDQLTILVREPPQTEPEITIISIGPPGNVLKNPEVVSKSTATNVTCLVDGGYPPVTSQDILLTCGNISGSEQITLPPVDSTDGEIACSCSASHITGCYSRSAHTRFNVSALPLSPEASTDISDVTVVASASVAVAVLVVVVIVVVIVLVVRRRRRHSDTAMEMEPMNDPRRVTGQPTETCKSRGRHSDRLFEDDLYVYPRDTAVTTEPEDDPRRVTGQPTETGKSTDGNPYNDAYSDDTPTSDIHSPILVTKTMAEIITPEAPTDPSPYNNVLASAPRSRTGQDGQSRITNPTGQYDVFPGPDSVAFVSDPYTSMRPENEYSQADEVDASYLSTQASCTGPDGYVKMEKIKNQGGNPYEND
ncbi:uncharacterized protein LOC101849838 [Aplysia californica]|uniref:Uncharacterized protein LOC101849838 n=1 Tax=Aplysia californica TaxID=6500 RepID=A0ABM0JLX1_APLCA|nr:uncharacterized protein LOC101849838 [Aplysia californica]